MKKILTIILLILTGLAIAQSPLERAANIKEWRANCSDPDPDLRLAYLEAAIATKDETLIRTCIKQAFLSDNPDVKNLALRAAMASKKRFTIQFTMPKEYTNKLKQLSEDENEKGILELNKKFSTSLKHFNKTNGTISIIAKNVAINKDISKWFTLGINSSENDRYIAEFSIIGQKFNGSGVINMGGTSQFVANFMVNSQGTLKGEISFIQSSTTHKMPAEIKLY